MLITLLNRNARPARPWKACSVKVIIMKPRMATTACQKETESRERTGIGMQIKIHWRLERHRRQAKPPSSCFAMMIEDDDCDVYDCEHTLESSWSRLVRCVWHCAHAYTWSAVRNSRTILPMVGHALATMQHT